MMNGEDESVVATRMEALYIADDDSESIKQKNKWLRSELDKKDRELTHYREMELRNQINTLGGMALTHFTGPAQRNTGTPKLVDPVPPISYLDNRESDRLLRLFPEGLMPDPEVNSTSLKQDLKLKVQEHEKEIMQLRKHISEYSAKETELHQEKHNLEKRIAHMHVALDHQQRDLVVAASRSVSYRQDIAEENIRLAYTLQAAKQQRSTYISSLMPLLAEYSLDSTVVDAQSVVGNVKVLFRHLHENLMQTEAKLKETRYQISPHRSDMAIPNATQSPSNVTGTKDGIGLVQSPQYPDGNVPVSPDPHQVTSEADSLLHRQSVFGISAATTLEQDETPRFFPLASRNTTSQYITAHHPVNHEDFHPAHNNEAAISNKRISSLDLVSNNEFDDSDMEIHQDHTEPPLYQKDAGPPSSWAPKGSSYKTKEPTSSYSPYLPVVSEERSSSFSEEDDILPTIEGLQISGDAFPGRELQAYGLSKHGTTNCNFEWVRHLEDGSFNYIQGANQPQYLITADDVDSYLAIEVQPLDDRNRKGAMVKVFANNQNKITCDLEMHNCITRTIDSGHASYRVSLSIGYLDMWEPATLSVKKNSYSIKCSGPRGVVVSEKYSPSTAAIVPSGSQMEFKIVDSQGDEHLLQAHSTDISTCRDTIVLALRYFIIQVMESSSCSRNVDHVIIDLDDVAGEVDIPQNASYVLNGLDTMNPVLVIDGSIYLIGKYEETIGECLLLYESDGAPVFYEETGPSEFNLFSGTRIVDSSQIPLKHLQKVLKFRLMTEAEKKETSEDSKRLATSCTA